MALTQLGSGRVPPAGTSNSTIEKRTPSSLSSPTSSGGQDPVVEVAVSRFGPRDTEVAAARRVAYPPLHRLMFDALGDTHHIGRLRVERKTVDIDAVWQRASFVCFKRCPPRARICLSPPAVAVVS
ncbi:hypothetical protein PG994_002707 [Apiospora phragmitis]|uniref:Uncharacterized protein n=1 Tax=Apiospora phragmitis TaxID=2905665 RepID=A0ABR1W5Z3_9PEZI